MTDTEKIAELELQVNDLRRLLIETRMLIDPTWGQIPNAEPKTLVEQFTELMDQHDAEMVRQMKMR